MGSFETGCSSTSFFFRCLFFVLPLLRCKKMWKKRRWSLATSKFSHAIFGSDAKIPRRPFFCFCGGQNPAVVAAKRKFLPDEVGEVFFFSSVATNFQHRLGWNVGLPGNSAIVTFLTCLSDPLNGWLFVTSNNRGSKVTSHESPGRFVVVLLDLFFSPRFFYGGMIQFDDCAYFSGFGVQLQPPTQVPELRFSRGGDEIPKPSQQSYLWKR